MAKQDKRARRFLWSEPLEVERVPDHQGEAVARALEDSPGARVVPVQQQAMPLSEREARSLKRRPH